jgi:pSer/pThr/pTyr-binding forkhead associated (FHA) protein
VAILKFINQDGGEDIVHVGPDKPKVSIGRSKECDLRIRNPVVSRVHASVHYRDGKYILEDHNSANGTYYKQEKIQEAVLEDGATFACGTIEVGFHLDEIDRTAKREAQPPVEELEIPPIPEAPPAGLDQTFAYEDQQAEGIEIVPAEALEPVEVAPVEPAGAMEQQFPHAEIAPVIELEQAIQQEAFDKGREGEPSKRIAELEAELAKRDKKILELSSQVQDLNRQLEAKAQSEEAELRISDLERIVATTEAEKEALEADLEVQKKKAQEAVQKAQDAEAKFARILAEMSGLKKDKMRDAERLAMLEKEGREAKERAARLEKEKMALEEEVQRWERLKSQFESEQSKGKSEIESLRRDLASFQSEVERMRDASKRAQELEAQVKSATDEIAELRHANRAYLKKVAKLLEENEALKAGKAQGADIKAVRDVAERINDLASECKTLVDVVEPLVSQITPVASSGLDEETVEEIRGAVRHLSQVVRQIKESAIRMRTLAKEAS